MTAAGVNIHPEDLEAALNRQEGIRASSVIGVEGRQGPEPVAVLLLRDPSRDAAVAVANANRELAAHQQIRHWLIWPEADFPRTPTQKIRKPALADWIRSQADSGCFRCRTTRCTFNLGRTARQGQRRSANHAGPFTAAGCRLEAGFPGAGGVPQPVGGSLPG